MSIRKATVLGAGVMGSQIAALLVNGQNRTATSWDDRNDMFQCRSDNCLAGTVPASFVSRLQSCRRYRCRYGLRLSVVDWSEVVPEKERDGDRDHHRRVRNGRVYF